MKKKILSKISFFPLKEISTNGGNVLQGIKKSEEGYNGFGELYYSWIEFGFIKAWKKHSKMTMNLTVPFGKVKFVFFDANDNKFISKIIGMENYYRITVPPGIWFGFMGKYNKRSLVVNFANIEHSDDEVEKQNINKFDYEW